MTLHELFPPSLAPAFRLVGMQLVHLDVTREEGSGDKREGRAQHFHRSFHQKEVYSCAMWSDATMEKRSAAAWVKDGGGWGESAREREDGGEERAEKAETEGDSKGLITAYHLEYNLYRTNLQRDSTRTVGG